MSSLNREQTSFYIVFIGVLVLTAFLFLPYLSALILGSILAVLFHPLFKKIIFWVGGQRFTASFLVILIILIIIFLPLGFLGRQVIFEASSVLERLTADRAGVLSSVETTLENLVPGDAHLDLQSYANRLLNWFLSHLGGIFSGIANFALILFLSLLTTFYLLKDGENLRDTFTLLSPLSKRDDDKIINKLITAVRSVVGGVMSVAIIQGFLTGIGFWLFSLPNPSLWGGVAMIAALVPGVGTSLILAPGVAYLLITQNFISALGLSIWGMTAVGLIDNFLGPIIIGRGIEIHPLLLLLSVLGGISLFGPIGFLAGPLVLALLFALLDIYKEIILK